MTMFNKFINDEAGAVTIDWVALTAGIALLAIAITVALSGDITSVVTGIQGELEGATDNIDTPS